MAWFAEVTQLWPELLCWQGDGSQGVTAGNADKAVLVESS